MLKLWTTLWIILTIVLLSFPLGALWYFLTKRILKSSKFFMQKFCELKALDKMRVDILQKRVQENETEDIRKDIDEAKKYTDIEKENIYVSWTKESSNKPNPWKKDLWDDKSIIVKKVKTKEEILKEKKMLEKLHYEALMLKKEWKLDQYEKVLIEWLAIDPDNKEFNQLLADLYFTIWNHNKALSLLKKLIESDPHNHSAIWQIGEIYLITGDFETAELLIEKAISLKPSNPKYHISMVEVLYNTDRKKDAINIMEKVVRLRPSNTSYIFTLANLYEEIWDMDSAKKYYFRVLEYEPSNENAKKKLKVLS